jgi:hypothetical protein
MKRPISIALKAAVLLALADCDHNHTGYGRIHMPKSGRAYWLPRKQLNHILVNGL